MAAQGGFENAREAEGERLAPGDTIERNVLPEMGPAGRQVSLLHSLNPPRWRLNRAFLGVRRPAQQLESTHGNSHDLAVDR